MKIASKFNIGDDVKLRHDSMGGNRMVTGICIRKDSITYNLAQAQTDSWHYDFEIEKINNEPTKAGFIK